MVRGRFGWGSSKDHPLRVDWWGDRLWLIGLLLAALLLYFMNLGSLPLRDWDEGIVAQVAREIYRAPAGSQTWLYPTLLGEPYLNKPPLMHWLIAGAYAIAGVNEWTARAPGAFLTALSVPLLYGIGREIFARRSAAVFSALVYLTLMPVVRHGRLAMLDGAVVCFFLLTVWCLLRARRDLRWGLGAGIGLGLMCLTKGILGVLLGAIVGVFLLWDTPRLFTSLYLWAGIWLGCAPVLLWYGAQWIHYSQGLVTNLQEQSLNRIWSTVEGHRGPPWYYLIEILKYSLPWLIFLPQGFRSAWEHRNLGWAKLVLVWSGSYLLIISIMGTKLPWYVLPIYPALALVVGAQFGEVWQAIYPGFLQAESRPYPRYWVILLALIAVICWVGSAYFGWFSAKPELDVQLILVSVAFTLTAAAFLAYKRDFQFLLVLFWGCYVSLGLFFNSNHWVWELAEAYSVKPIAQLIQKNTPPEQVIYTSYPYHRPSLNFYSDRRVIPATPAILQQQWQMTAPYLLVDAETLRALQLNQAKTIGTAEKWILVTRSSNSKLLPFTYTPAAHVKQAPNP
jgi:4-amino-4-deoxy-L-arabinose transferase-like glycosyltransferase